MSSADPSLSSVKLSISAIGLQPVDYRRSELVGFSFTVLTNLAYEFHFIPLDVFYGQYVGFRKEM